MCNCIEETEQRFKEHLKENDKTFKDIEDFEVGFENKSIIFKKSKGELALTLPMEVEWKHTAKSGRVSAKRKTQHFVMEYCPFCGEKQSKESAINE